MSRERKLESAALVTLVFFVGVACDKAPAAQGPQKAHTPLVIPTQTIELGGTLFEQASCNKGEITFQKPMGWSVLEVSVTSNLTNCYVTEGQLTREEDFKKGFRVSSLALPYSEQDRLSYAKQLVSQPDGRGLLPVANTYTKTKEGTLTIFSGKFTGNSRNVYTEEERKIIVVDGSNLMYIIAFNAPAPAAADDFKRYGRQMLDKVQVKVKSNI